MLPDKVFDFVSDMLLIIFSLLVISAFAIFPLAGISYIALSVWEKSDYIEYCTNKGEEKGKCLLEWSRVKNSACYDLDASDRVEYMNICLEKGKTLEECYESCSQFSRRRCCNNSCFEE